MATITTHEEYVALDLGMQIILRHRLQTHIEAIQAHNRELEIRVKELEGSLAEKVETASHAWTAQVGKP